jgi:hypothetical protein
MQVCFPKHSIKEKKKETKKGEGKEVTNGPKRLNNKIGALSLKTYIRT